MFANPDYTAPRLQVFEVKWLEFSVRTWAFFIILFTMLSNTKQKMPEDIMDIMGYGQRALPGGRDHYDGPGVDQVCVKQSPPPTAVQVGAFDHVRV